MSHSVSHGDTNETLPSTVVHVKVPREQDNGRGGLGG